MNLHDGKHGGESVRGIESMAEGALSASRLDFTDAYRV
jgi:hypothetical protein